MIGREIMAGVDVSDVTTGLFEPGWGYWSLGIMGAILLVVVTIFLSRCKWENVFKFLLVLVMVFVSITVAGLVNAIMDEEVNPSRSAERVIDYYGLQPEADFTVPDEGRTTTAPGVVIREADGSWSGPQDVTLTNDNGVVIALVLNESGKLVPLPPANP